MDKLMWGFHHLTAGHGLLHYYATHGAVAFLMSGQTSESPHTRLAARVLLHWLAWRYGAGHNGISPVDW